MSNCFLRAYSVVSDRIQWLSATCGWVFLEVVSSLMMETCESQQQLRGDGLRQEHCVRCGQRVSSVVPLPRWKATGHPDTALTSACMTSVRDPRDRSITTRSTNYQRFFSGTSKGEAGYIQQDPARVHLKRQLNTKQYSKVAKWII